MGRAALREDAGDECPAYIELYPCFSNYGRRKVQDNCGEDSRFHPQCAALSRRLLRQPGRGQRRGILRKASGGKGEDAYSFHRQEHLCKPECPRHFCPAATWRKILQCCFGNS